MIDVKHVPILAPSAIAMPLGDGDQPVTGKGHGDERGRGRRLNHGAQAASDGKGQQRPGACVEQCGMKPGARRQGRQGCF
ncbi:hypothetical protein [Alicyclobacillus sacchari]|uniref:hypothetical protein n=1 Tax=Alicyclobacillus sacchari TaxID=392010 RepID=UPI003D67DAC5